MWVGLQSLCMWDWPWDSDDVPDQYLSCSISYKSLYDLQVHNISIAIDSIVNVFTLFTNNWQTKSMPGSQVQQLRKNNWTHHSWVYLRQLLCRPERIEKSFNKTQ